jgi:hypothetical protein
LYIEEFTICTHQTVLLGISRLRCFGYVARNGAMGSAYKIVFLKPEGKSFQLAMEMGQ